ncbi:MAG TPA: patatin-like phospholipase family protein [Candidatus Saccharimonadales bacterium]|nr:patatin-like phospholipase family protein [Candidatus Saccharimonadales bacterium]
MSRYAIFRYLFALCLMATQPLMSQTQVTESPVYVADENESSHTQKDIGRPVVGVALSGGGALGLSHIGVIRYFEEHHIPIDRIAGTSMGGLIGGLYATGLDASDLTSIAEHANWNLLLSATPQYRDQPIVEKQGWNRSYGNLTLRLGRRFSLPQGINSGEALSMMLSRNTAAYGDMESFDDLPTPFRCVATDLIKAEGVVLGRGSLAKAMRATMALPAIFTPVAWEGKVLVDGGLIQNLPVEVAQSMGAEKTIAVTLKGGFPQAKDLTSLSSILLRSASVAIEQNERRSAKLADIVIAVDTGRFSGSDYARARDLIQAGYEAAKARAEELKSLEIGSAEWETYLEHRRHRLTYPLRAPVVSVTAHQESFRRDATQELKRKLGSGPVGVREMEDTLSGMVAATGVPGASYEWNQKEGGYNIDFLRRTGESILIRPSFAFSTSPGEPSQTALRLSLSRIGAGAYKSRALAAATVGYDPGLRAEYYRPIGGTGNFFAPGMFVERTHVNSYAGRVQTAQTRDRFGGSFYAGMGTWRFAQVRLGVRAGYDSYSRQVVTDGVVSRNHAFADPEVRWIYNTQDSGGLPYKGTRIEGAVGYSFRDRSYPFLRNGLTSLGPLSRYASWVGMGEIASSFGRKLNFYEQFTSGGSGQLGAYRYQEFHANTMVSAGGGVVFHAPPVRRLSVYPGIAVLYEAGRFDMGSLGWQTHQSTTAAVFFPTPIGAGGIGVSFNEAGKARFRLSLGALGKR